MCGKVAVFIHIAVHDGWCHPGVGQNEIDPTFFGVFIRVARGSTRLPITLAFIVSDVGPPMFFDEGHGGWEGIQAAVEVSHNDFGPWVHCLELQFYDGKYVVSSCRYDVPFFAPVQP